MNQLPIVINGKHFNKHNLSVAVKINNNILSTANAHGNINVNFEYDENAVVRHEFELIVTGKVQLLNSIDNFSIIKDHAIESAYIIEGVKFEEYDVTPILATAAKYYHTQNNNSTQVLIEDYTNWLGYDGIVKFTFVTPVFAWFLSDFEY